MARCGTRSAYTAGCHCGACRAANSAYQVQRAARAKNPTLADAAAQQVPAAPVRDHLRALAAAGVGLRALAAATGLSRSQLSKIRSGTARTVRPRTRDAVLAIQPTHAAAGALVDAAPTWRRIDALLAAGWTKSRLAAELGRTGRGLQLGRRRVTKANADRIEEIWRRHVVEAVPPPGHGTLGEYRQGCRCVFCRRASAEHRARMRSGTPPPPDHAELFAAIAELPELRSETWRSSAECAGGPTRLWFPDPGVDAHPLVVETCARCTVAAECAASRRGDTGVRAGVGEPRAGVASPP